MNTFGLTEWNNVELGSGRSSSKIDYLKLTNGSNVVRILTKPFQYSVHLYKAHINDDGFGTRIVACEGSDPLVEAGSKPKKRWLLGIIDRKTNSYKVIDISTTVFKSIQELVRDSDWGDPSQYDVDIKVDNRGGPTGYYSVIAKPKKPLTAEDLEIKQTIDLDALKQRSSPLSYDKALELMRVVQAKSPHFQAKKNGESTPVVSSVDDDDDEDFPSA